MIIIRSSVYPNICKKIYKIIKDKCKNLSYCPERIVQGQALKELPNLPQLVSGFNNHSINESQVNYSKKYAKKLFILKFLRQNWLNCFLMLIDTFIFLYQINFI